MSEEKTAPIIEHLVELRKRLVIIVIAVVVGMGVAWNYSGDLLKFVEKPLTGKTYLTGIKKEVYLKVKELAPSMYTRYKLDQEINTPQKQRLLNYSAPLEPFFIQCKISMLAGFIMVLPIVFYQVWLFIAPGLTRSERRLVVPFVTAATVTFCIGALFFLIIIWPVIINFSLSTK
jgi:sec-independent protein translocase protein TatC